LLGVVGVKLRLVAGLPISPKVIPIRAETFLWFKQQLRLPVFVKPCTTRTTYRVENSMVPLVKSRNAIPINPIRNHSGLELCRAVAFVSVPIALNIAIRNR
jgi:hypothetical protein